MATEEVSLSIEETNRLRASLGLKPLTLEAVTQPNQPKEQIPASNAKAADDIRSKLADARERRRQEAKLKSTKTLGEADAEDVIDDVAAWVQKSRTLPAEPKRQAVDDDDKAKHRPRHVDDDDDEDGYNAEQLAGAKVRHNVPGELNEGETMILTLADRSILDEKGLLDEAPDELEDVLKAEDKRRKKARKAAANTAKPLWEEDGKVRSLLDKYDEEEAEMSMTIDEAGNLAAKQAREEEVRKKLAAGAALLLDGSNPSAAVAAKTAAASSGGGDYYTEAEMANMTKPKKKKRKLRAKQQDDDEQQQQQQQQQQTGLDLDALEAEASAAGGSDLRSRAARGARQEAEEANRLQQQQQRTSRFEHALEKANWASEMLRSSGVDADGDGDGDDELYETLERARRLAQKAASSSHESAPVARLSMDELAKDIARRREEDEAKQTAQAAEGTTETFTATTEFVRSIAVSAPDTKDDGSYMDIDTSAAAATTAEVPAVQPEAVKAPEQHKRRFRPGGWVSADADDKEEAVPDKQEPDTQHKTSEADEENGITTQKALGKGLGAALGLLKETGTFKERHEWAGRTNDKKASIVQGLADVYPGGMSEDRIGRSVEMALTQRDEFGRIMTPKDRFRYLCYGFHGMQPSKNKQEKRQQKYLEEMAIRKATTSEHPGQQLEHVVEMQKQMGTAYIPLTGKGAKPAGGNAGAGAATSGGLRDVSKTSLTPVLGGGVTPLTGNRKVEIMLGIKKPSAGGGFSSMPPPASKKPKS